MVEADVLEDALAPVREVAAVGVGVAAALALLYRGHLEVTKTGGFRTHAEAKIIPRMATWRDSRNLYINLLPSKGERIYARSRHVSKTYFYIFFGAHRKRKQNWFWPDFFLVLTS